MRLGGPVKPITYLKNRTAELVREVAEEERPVLVTQHGEAKVVVMSATTYERWQRALVLLKLAAQGEADLAAGRSASTREALARAAAAVRERGSGE